MRRPSERRSIGTLAAIPLLVLIPVPAEAEVIRSGPGPRTLPRRETAGETPVGSAGGTVTPRSDSPELGTGRSPDAVPEALSRPSDGVPADTEEEEPAVEHRPARRTGSDLSGKRPESTTGGLPGDGIAPDSIEPGSNGGSIASPYPGLPTSPALGARSDAPEEGIEIEHPGRMAGLPAVDSPAGPGAIPSGRESQRIEPGLPLRSSLADDPRSTATGLGDTLSEGFQTDLLPERGGDALDLGLGLGVDPMDTIDAPNPMTNSIDAALAWDTDANLNRLLDSSYGAEVRRRMFHETVPDPVVVMAGLREGDDAPDDGAPVPLSTGPRSGVTVATPEPSSLILIGLAAYIVLRGDPRRRRPTSG